MGSAAPRPAAARPAVPFTSKVRAELRGEAHHLSVMVHVGQQGLTPSVITAFEDALRTHELVKVQLARGLDAKPREVAQALAIATKAQIVQTIGRTATLYRANPELARKHGDPPPWRK
jgi:RNA-binding protein